MVGQKLAFAMGELGLCPPIYEAVSSYKEHAILCHTRQRRVESYKCITNSNRWFYAYHKVLNWNSLQRNHQEWYHTHCIRPHAELGADYKEWSLPGYSKNLTETMSGSCFASTCWHTEYWNINDYCMMGRRHRKRPEAKDVVLLNTELSWMPATAE